MNPSLVRLMAIASGATVANLYYNQPLLALIAQNFHVTSHTAGLIPMLTQIGYAVGILLFVPLGDVLERRQLIVTMLGATAVSLGLSALSLNILWLMVASFAIGMTAISAQVMVPLAAQLAEARSRGKVVGTVMSGLLIGVLLARTISGYIGAVWGWREMYWLACGVTLGLAVILWKQLPESRPSSQTAYLGLMQSLLPIARSQPVLQESAIIGAACFGAFSAFWSTLVFFLAQPPYHYGSDVTGLFGLIGVTGAIAAPVVGKLADRRSPRLTVGWGIAITTLAFLIFWAVGYQLWGLVIGVIVLDLGVQTTQISNQARIYSLPQEIHSRLNAVYITLYFVGGALGSFLGAYGWSHWQWHGVCAFGLLLLVSAWVVYLCNIAQTNPEPRP